MLPSTYFSVVPTETLLFSSLNKGVAKFSAQKQNGKSSCEAPGVPGGFDVKPQFHC